MRRLVQQAARALGSGLLLLGPIATAAPPAAPVPIPVPEKLVTSALVYNLAKLTEWPAAALGATGAPLTLCLLGAAETGEELFASVAGKPVQGRPLAIRREVKLSQLDGCQLLYLDELDEPRLTAVLKAVRGLPVLTVGGFEGFAEAGGMVGLFLQQEQMQFRINRRAVAEAQLSLSSQLLRMARIVDGAPP